MKKTIFTMVLCVICFTCTACDSSGETTQAKGETKTIIDMAGRSVQVPVEIDKIYATGQPGVVMLYTVDPEYLLGWCLNLSDDEARYIEPEYLGLPVLGVMQGSKDTANREEILHRAPDVLLTVTVLDKASVEDVDKLQELLGIPIVMGDVTLSALPECYRMIGELTGETKRAEELAFYCEKTLKNAHEIAASIPKNKRKTVYYAQGGSGLQTAPKNSTHSEVIDLVGGENVVKLNGDTDGRANVNMEQVLTYNPQVIIASYSVGHTNTRGDEIFNLMISGQEAWNDVKAVKEGEVYATPCLPYNWLDIPPSANRIIGVHWMGNLLYPDYFKLDIKEKTKEFYELFYRNALDSEHLEELLSGAVKKIK